MLLNCNNLLQGGHQATMLHDEMTTMRQSYGISMKRLQVLTRRLSVGTKEPTTMFVQKPCTSSASQGSNN